MNNKSYNLLKLTLIYFFLSIIFLLFFQFSLVIAIFSVFPADIKIFLINVFKNLSSLELIKSPPSFLQPFFAFILMELPFVLLGFVISYLLFRKKYEKKYHLLAATFSLLGILIIGSFTVIKPMSAGEHKFPSFFSVQSSIREVRCNLLPKESIFNWTYPTNGQTNVSIHSPVAVNLKKGIRISSSCDTTYVNGRYASSSKMLGNITGGNIPLVPDGTNPISELNYLSSASINEIQSFESSGRWDNNTTIRVTCNYIRSGCSGSESFTFSVGIPEKTQQTSNNCSQLSLAECVKNLNCDPEYSGPSCPVCLDIGKYVGCRSNSEKKERKSTCEATNGYWNVDEVHHCQCPENKGEYIRGSNGNLGCLTNEELCVQTSGTYGDSCICPSGTHWEWNFGCYKSN